MISLDLTFLYIILVHYHWWPIIHESEIKSQFFREISRFDQKITFPPYGCQKEIFLGIVVSKNKSCPKFKSNSYAIFCQICNPWRAIIKKKLINKQFQDFYLGWMYVFSKNRIVKTSIPFWHPWYAINCVWQISCKGRKSVFDTIHGNTIYGKIQ